MTKFNAKTAIALLDSTTVTAPQVKRFGDGIAKMFLNIPQRERTNAAHAILIGMALPILKGSMKHGEFRPWMKANLTKCNIWTEATAYKNASLFTRLAHAFIEEKQLGADEILSITSGKAMQGKPGKDAHAVKLMAAIEDFIGEQSLAELINNHVSGSGSNAPTKTLGAGEDPLLADTAAHLMGLREILLTPETLKRFTAKQLDDIERQVASLPEEFRKLKAKLRS